MDAQTAQRIATATAKISGIPMPQAAESPTEQTPPQETATEQTAELAGDQTTETVASDQQPADSGVEEIEFEGVKFPLPKEHVQKVKDALLRTADYTRKNQDLSDRARVVAEQEKIFRAQQQFHQTSIDDIAQIRALDQAIAQYANVNWMAMQTDELMRTRLQYDQLKEAREKAKQSLDQKWGQFNQTRDAQMKALEKAGRDEAARRISGFDEKQARELADYAKTAGYTEAQVGMLFYNPLDIEMIWKAKQFDALQSTKGALQQRANKAPPMSRPGPSAQQKPAAVRLQEDFKGAKDRARKELFGARILANKMGFKT